MKYKCNPFLDKDYDKNNPIIEVSPIVWLLLNLTQWYITLSLIASLMAGVLILALISPIAIPFLIKNSISMKKQNYSISG